MSQRPSHLYREIIELSATRFLDAKRHSQSSVALPGSKKVSGRVMVLELVLEDIGGELRVSFASYPFPWLSSRRDMAILPRYASRRRTPEADSPRLLGRGRALEIRKLSVTISRLCADRFLPAL